MMQIKLITGMMVFGFIIVFLVTPVHGVTTQGMVGYWKFDGNARDISGYQHHGTLHHGPLFVGGQVNQCLAVGDNNGYVTLNNSDGGLNILHSFTIEAWIKGNHWGSGYHYIYSKEGSHTLSVCDGKIAAKGPGDWWKPGSTQLHSKQWYHIAWTYDGSHKKIYINGEKKASTLAPGKIPPGGNVYIGHPAYRFNGLIDEVKIYDRALSAVEIKSIYYEGSALVGYWPLEGNANDYSGYQHKGTEFGKVNYEGSLVSLGLKLNGNNDYVALDNSDGVLALSEEVTIEAWIRADIFANKYQQIYGHSGSHILGVFRTRLSMAWGGEWWTPDTTDLKTKQWYYVAGTYDGSRMKLYINGKEATSTAQTGKMPPGTRVKISHHTNGFQGLVDEVKVYNRALPPNVIRNHYEEIPKPLAIWTFDNHCHDKSGCDHHGKLINGPHYIRGKINQCLYFDGNNDYVLVNNGNQQLTPGRKVTIEAWIKGDVFKRDYHHIYDKYGALTLSIKDGKLAMSGYGGWRYPDSTALKPHEWYHVAVTCEHGEKRLYINGVLKDNSPFKRFPGKGNAVYISNPYFPFNGLIDEVKIYDCALSAREILIRYQAGCQ